MNRKRGLGKGLGALLGEYMDPKVQDSSEVRRVKLTSIVPNPLQPRRVFTDAELDELAASIEANGLLQPLVLRPAPGAEDRFELIAGERRFRAVSRLGWEDVPAIVRECSDETLLVLALVENLQREALNPLEEAEGYQTLMDRFDLTQGEVAESVGKNRSTVANLLRLLKLPPSVKALLAEGRLSGGHARALLAVADPMRQAELGRRAAEEGWSVREVERRAGSAGPKKAKRQSRPDPVLRALEEELQAHFATRVRVKRGRGKKGAIEIPFHGDEDFERVFVLLTGREASEVVG